MRRILCYGDSNTYGFDPTSCPPGAGTAGRYAEDVRWAALLGGLLGEDFSVIEAGLNGRTTVFDDPLEPGRNGQAFLLNVFQMNDPIELVVIMLGTNDTKQMYSASCEVISCGMDRLVAELKWYISRSLNPACKILVVSPIAIRPSETGKYVYDFCEASTQKMEELPVWYEALAKNHGVAFMDAAKVTEPGPVDGVHLEKEQHAIFAKAMAEKIREVLGA